MKYQHRVLGMLSLLSVITYLDRVCIAVALCALCLDVGRKNAGAVFGFMNTAASGASALSSVVIGYLVGYFGNYNVPFIPMVGLLALGAVLWWQVDPTRELFPEVAPAEGDGGPASHEREGVVPA